MASFSSGSAKVISSGDRVSSISSRLSALGSRYKNLVIKYPHKEKSYFDLRPCLAQNEGHEIACSELFWATAYAGGGGPVYVSRHDSIGRIELDCPLINGHSSAVNDIAFSQFKSTLMATASKDCSVKLWQLPHDEPLISQTASEAVVTLNGFSNSVRTVNFHPTCANVLACTSLDKTVSIYDVEAGGDPLCRLDLNVACASSTTRTEAPNIINMSFNYDGSAYAIACKDNNVRIVDPRLGPGSAIVQQSVDGTLGRNLRVEWCSNGSSACSALLTVSVSSSAMRTVHLWDPRNWSAPLSSRSIDTAAGQLYPMYDQSAGICFVAGKGDATVRALEINMLRLEDTESECGDRLSALVDKAADFPAAADRSTYTGMCLMPKSCCDVTNIEVARLLKLTTTGVSAASITLPRADHLREFFQDDIFRPVQSASQSHNVEDFRNWLHAGEGEESFIGPFMESLQPSGMIPLSEKPIEEPKVSRVSSFRAAKEAEEREARLKEENMARLTAMANIRAEYHPNTSMGGATEETDSDDNWDD